MPIAGRLSDVYGRRQVFVAAYSLFLVGTILRGRLEEPVRYYGAAGPEPVSTRPDSCADPVTFARGPA